MAQMVVTLKLRVAEHAKLMLEEIARAAGYKTSKGRLDLGRVVEEILEDDLRSAVRVRQRRSGDDATTLQEAVEDHQYYLKQKAAREKTQARLRRRDAEKTLKRIKP